MTERKKMWTDGPWKWQGEDYRGGWGWQMLVGPNGEGLIVGQDDDGPCSHLRAFMPLDPSLCVTGMLADGKDRANAVHVFCEANAHLITAAPELVEALELDLTLDSKYNWNVWNTSTGELVEVNFPTHDDALQFIIEKKKAALAKAYGETNHD